MKLVLILSEEDFPRGYWDMPGYYTVLSQDGSEAVGVLMETLHEDYWWYFPVEGAPGPSFAQETPVAEYSVEELEVLGRPASYPNGGQDVLAQLPESLRAYFLEPPPGVEE